MRSDSARAPRSLISWRPPRVRGLPALALAVLTSVGCARSQDLIASGGGMALVRIDAVTLAITSWGPNPGFGVRGLAVSAGTYWAAVGPPVVPHLVQIDANGNSTTSWPVPWLDTLTDDGTAGLIAVAHTVPGVGRLDLTTGAFTPVANYPFSMFAPAALVRHQGELCGWDRVAGFFKLDPNTLALRQTFPVPPGQVPPPVLFLCSHPDGRLLCGLSAASPGSVDLGVVDASSGAVTALGSLGNNPQLRACVPMPGLAQPFGAPCGDATGPAILVAGGILRVGGHVNTVSINHATGTIGALLLGTSASVNAGQPLPLLLDPLLGTSGCHLYTSIDATILGPTPTVPPATLVFTFAIPLGGAGLRFFAQHAAFAPVPGHLSWSNGMLLQID